MGVFGPYTATTRISYSSSASPASSSCHQVGCQFGDGPEKAPMTRPAGPAGGARSSTVAGLAPARPNEKDMAGFGPAS